MGQIDTSRLPSWALSMTASTQAWLAQLTDDVLSDPLLWQVVTKYQGEVQGAVLLAHIAAEVQERRASLRGRS
jgi:hypothetical protein